MKEGSQKSSLGCPSLPRPELNPLTNPILGRNLGRWAQVYFTSPPEKREQAVSDLLRDLEAEPSVATEQKTVNSSVPASSTESSSVLISTLREARDSVQSAVTAPETECSKCSYVNSIENRFCGYCGEPLGENSLSPPESASHSETRPLAQEQDHELEWLRNKDLASFQVKPGHSFGWVKYTLALAAAGIAALLFFQSRERISSPVQAPPPAKVSSAQAPRNSVPERPIPDRKTDKSVIQAASLKKEQSRAIAQPVRSLEEAQRVNPVSDPSDPDLRLAQAYLQNRNAPDAARLLWKAVGRNNTEAALSLSQLYARGEGVPKNCDQARLLLVAAAKRGSSAAAQQLRQFDSAVCH